MKIRTGIFTDNYNYSAKKNWPVDTAMQAGGGSIDGIGKIIFLEANFKDYYVRGEGNTIEEAESNAFKLYEKYMNCDHSFTRMGDDSRIGVCNKCSLKKRDFFELISKCAICEKIGAAHHFDKKIYCFNHYKESINLLLKNEENKQDEENINQRSITGIKHNLWIVEKLEEVGVITEGQKDADINRSYFDYKNGYFEYMLMSCQIYYNKYKSKDYKLHYVDLYEEIEENKEIYSGMFEVYIVENKNIKAVNSIDNYKSLFENYIKNKVS